MPISIDFEARKAVARWARQVSLEDPGLPDHGARAAVARRMLESIAPATPAADDALVHVVFLVRSFMATPEEEATRDDVEGLVVQAMETFVALGAFSA